MVRKSFFLSIFFLFNFVFNVSFCSEECYLPGPAFDFKKYGLSAHETISIEFGDRVIKEQGLVKRVAYPIMLAGSSALRTECQIFAASAVLIGKHTPSIVTVFVPIEVVDRIKREYECRAAHGKKERTEEEKAVLCEALRTGTIFKRKPL